MFRGSVGAVERAWVLGENERGGRFLAGGLAFALGLVLGVVGWRRGFGVGVGG